MKSLKCSLSFHSEFLEIPQVKFPKINRAMAGIQTSKVENLQQNHLLFIGTAVAPLYAQEVAPAALSTGFGHGIRARRMRKRATPELWSGDVGEG